MPGVAKIPTEATVCNRIVQHHESGHSATGGSQNASREFSQQDKPPETCVAKEGPALL
jgi:hypothetical protein